MSLARVFTNIGSAIIRNIGDVGGPPADRVSQELDNLIAWAKASPRCIQRDFSVVNSAGVGPDVLHTFSLPANSLQANGDYLTVWYGGNFAANVRGKAVQAQFDGQNYEAAGVTDIQAALGWGIAARIARLSATTVQISHFLLENALGINTAGTPTSYSTGGNVFSRNTPLTVANLNSNAIVMRVRSVVAAGAAAADVFQNMSIIELVQQ